MANRSARATKSLQNKEKAENKKRQLVEFSVSVLVFFPLHLAALSLGRSCIPQAILSSLPLSGIFFHHVHTLLQHLLLSTSESAFGGYQANPGPASYATEANQHS